MKSNKVIFKSLIYLLLVIGSVSMLIPFIWMISTSLKTAEATFILPPQLIPEKITLNNFRKVANAFPVDRFFYNSLFVSVVSTLGQLIICSMSAYVFARIDFKYRDKLFLIYLGTMMVPSQVTLTPLFIIMRTLRWANTYKALILPGMFRAFGTFLMRQFFLTVPKSLEEAAFIDGANYFRIFFRIFIPLSRPALATLTIFSFMESWNNLLWPLIITNDVNHMTLPLGLASLQGRWETDWNLLMAGTVISVIPILIVYIFAQKHFIEGMTHTGLK